jgi:hypothetical protein
MKKALGWALLPAMFLTLSTLAQANDWSKVRVYRAGYEQGYRAGMVRGEHGYREDAGYAKWMGHRGEYKKGYREGFQAAYQGNAHGRFARRDPRYAGRHPGGYLSNGYWGGSDYRDYGRGRFDHDLAFERGMDRGYLKGLEKGREDFRKHRNSDPARHKQYRDADDGYKSSYGDRRNYEAGYRRAFEDGYRQAYRPYGSW